MVHIIFLMITGLTITLLVAKRCILKGEQRKRVRSDEIPCDSFLPNGMDELKMCTNSVYQNEYRIRGSCQGCKGKTVEEETAKLEREIRSAHTWKSVVVKVADVSTAFVLPYLAIAYTFCCGLLGIG